MIKIIAAMSLNRVIGCDGVIPWYYPDDLKFFKEMTNGCPIVMGRKTFESLPKILPGRKHVVLTRGKTEYNSKVLVVDSLEKAFDLDDEVIWVIGGESIYNQSLEFADEIYLTLINRYVEGDTFFPELTTDEWDEQILSTTDDITFLKYDRIRDASF